MNLVKVGDIEFYTSDDYTLEDLLRCQQKSKEMVEIIIDIFDRHGIDYFMAHGSLLGMVRHKGFIPWDDDCDLFLFDSQYARAIEILRRELPNDMIVHNKRTDPIYWCKWTKIRDAHSDTEESLWKIDRKLKYHGICIDLLRITPMRKGEYIYFKKSGKIIKSLNAAKSIVKSKNRRFIRRLYCFVKFCLHKLRLTALRVVTFFLREKMLYANLGTIIEAEMKYKDVFPLQTKAYPFEDLMVNAPKNPDGVLKSMYGDYMKLPPLEKRLPHFSKVRFFDD